MLESSRTKSAGRKNVRTKTGISLLCGGLALATSGCGQDSGQSYSIHDTKYIRISSAGKELGAEASSWPCVLDRYTGLMWEVKSTTAGLHFSDNTYSWYNPTEDHDQGLDYRGTPNGGRCEGSDCDTWAYVLAVNHEGYCGYHDWRLPLKDELASISDPRKLEAPPTINMRYFPLTQPDEYWSSNDYSFQWDSAWVWNFRHGHDRVDWKKSPKRVRLVRGEAEHLKRVEE